MIDWRSSWVLVTSFRCSGLYHDSITNGCWLHTWVTGSQKKLFRSFYRSPKGLRYSSHLIRNHCGSVLGCLSILFENYLSERTQYVEFDGISSRLQLHQGSPKVRFWVHFCLLSMLTAWVKMPMILRFIAVVLPLLNHFSICSLPFVL